MAGAVSGAGLVVLNLSANQSLTLSGSSTAQCPVVYVNSTSNACVRGSGSAVLDTPTLKVCGGCSFSAPAHCTSTGQTIPGPVPDPGASLVMPSTSGMTNRGNCSLGSGTWTVNPGYYPNGITVSGGTANFQPGVYVIGANGLTAQGGATLNGQGVTFVVLAGKVTLSGGSSANLTAMSGGALDGVLIAQPPSNTSDMTLSGGSAMVMTGTIWAPKAKATVSGSSSVAGTGPQMGDMLICDTCTLSGSGTIKIGGATPAGPTPAVSLPVAPCFD
jgi:hypothetical protein